MYSYPHYLQIGAVLQKLIVHGRLESEALILRNNSRNHVITFFSRTDYVRSKNKAQNWSLENLILMLGILDKCVFYGRFCRDSSAQHGSCEEMWGPDLRFSLSLLIYRHLENSH